MSKDKTSYSAYVGNIIWFTLLGVVIGAIVGFLLPMAVQLCSCLWNIATCGWNADVALAGADLVQWAIGGGALGGFIGLACGLFDANSEAKQAREKHQRELDEAARAMAEAIKKQQEQEERERQAKARRERQERQKRFNDWVARVQGTSADIIAALDNKNKDQAGDKLERLWRIGGETKRLDEQDQGGGRYNGNYHKIYSALERNIIAHTANFVTQALNIRPDHTALEGVEVGLSLLLAYYSRDAQTRLSDERAAALLAALSSVRESRALIVDDAYAISFDGYGEVSFGDEDPRTWSTTTAQAAYDDLERRLGLLTPVALRNDILAGTSTLDPSFFIAVTRLMWHYADATPFNVEKFDFTRRVYNAFSAGIVEDEKEGEVVFGTTEEVLARLYAKNKLGGASTAKQEEPYLLAWLDNRIEVGDDGSCFDLVSGLAWLELFDLEQRVLKTLVAHQVQLTAELQERLGVLESGRTRNVRLFDPEPSEDFLFDSSSVEWNANEFSIFFRKLAMKKTTLSYSLALSKWTKTLPLKRGQRIAQEDIIAELQDMVLDFDGEVTCAQVNAAAVDLTNLRYEDATLFSFTSERSRCVSVLISCEKYGRNLNVTMYTLFTPEAGLEVPALERYATAAKSNIYMESFRESVLQSLDDVLKVEKSIYGDDEDDAPEQPLTGRNVIA